MNDRKDIERRIKSYIDWKSLNPCWKNTDYCAKRTGNNFSCTGSTYGKCAKRKLWEKRYPFEGRRGEISVDERKKYIIAEIDPEKRLCYFCLESYHISEVKHNIFLDAYICRRCWDIGKRYSKEVELANVIGII